MGRNSRAPSRAFFTVSESVMMVGGVPSRAGLRSFTLMAQEATGFGMPATSIRHIRQLPAIDSRDVARLDQRDAVRHLMFFAVDDQLRHLAPHSAATGTDGAIGFMACSSMRASMTWRKW